MMGERETDKLLAELFKRNAPSVNEQALSERITARLRPRRRRRRRNRIARAVALGFASIVLVGAAAFGAYTAVDHFQRQPRLVFTDLNRGPGGPLLARVSPVMGTAVLEQVKNEGTSDPGNAADGIHRVRDRVEVYRLSMSQPLVTGTMEIRSNLATRPDGSTDIDGFMGPTHRPGRVGVPVLEGQFDSERFRTVLLRERERCRRTRGVDAATPVARGQEPGVVGNWGRII